MSFKCDHCNKKLKTKRGLKSHVTQMHPEVREAEEKERRDKLLEKEFTCPYCNEYGSDNLNSLRIHVSKSHDLSSPSKQLRIDLFENGNHPTCKCGCGEKVHFKSLQKGFNTYIRGHHVRETNGFWTEEGLEKSAETRREQFENGDREPWNKGLSLEENPDHEGLLKLRENALKENNPERAAKISNALQGHEVSEETRKKLRNHWKEYWSDPKHREEQSHRRMIWMKENDYTINSELESTFVDKYLNYFGIDFEEQKYIRDIKAYYDFWLPDYDVYIEIHGDFWHCNPTSDYSEAVYDCQKKNLENDKVKQNWCKENNKELHVFWEYDIKNNRRKVIKQILEIIE